jgi:serine/threonine protein kinase
MSSMAEPEPPARCPRCGTESAGGRLSACPVCLLEDDLPDVLGETYELLERIGEGGMGTVYRARHRRLDRVVAMKFLAEPLAAHPDLHERIEAEGRAMARLDHPHIVAVHDLGRSLGHSYIVMEYVDGTPLSRLLPIPLRQALELADQVCQALAYAHSRGVVHCDIKPQNILVDSSGRAKVSDFGIARVLGPLDLEDVVGPARLMGTQVYMAPEARRGAPADPSMDVYSLGVVLHEMVTGRPPLPGQDPTGPLSALLRTALHPDPARRYADAGEMRKDLAREARSAARFVAEPNEADRIRWAAGLLAFIATVGLQALYGALPFGRPPVMPWGSLAVGLGAMVTAAPILRALHRRWRQEARGTAPPDYVPLDGERLLPASMIALLAFAAWYAVDWLAAGWTATIARGAADLLGVVALYRAWVVFLDARRVRLDLVDYWALLALGLAPSLVPLLLAWIA